MAADNGWDDLFAKASGQHEVIEDLVKPKKKENRVSRKERRRAWNNVLAGRTDVPDDETVVGVPARQFKKNN